MFTKYQTFTNKFINHVIIFLLIYANFRQLNLFEVAQYLLYGVARYKYIPLNSRVIYFLGSLGYPCI